MRRQVLLLVLVAGACSSKKESGGGAGGGTSEVAGTVMVDGKARTITKCIVERRMDTRITLVFAGGSLAYEDDELYLYAGDGDDGILRGKELTCGDITGERYTGTSMGKPGYARGKLVAECTAPTAVKLDVTLTCGTMTPEDEKELEELKAKMRSPDPFGTGAAVDAGSAAPADMVDAASE